MRGLIDKCVPGARSFARFDPQSSPDQYRGPSAIDTVVAGTFASSWRLRDGQRRPIRGSVPRLALSAYVVKLGVESVKLYLGLCFILAFGIPLTIHLINQDNVGSASIVVLACTLGGTHAIGMHRQHLQRIAPSSAGGSHEEGASDQPAAEAEIKAQGAPGRPRRNVMNQHAVAFWILPPLLAVAVMSPFILSRGEGPLGERVAALAYFLVIAAFAQWIVYRGTRRREP